MKKKVNMKVDTMPRFILLIDDLKHDPDPLTGNHTTVSCYLQN